MSIKQIWHWPARSFQQPVTSSRTIAWPSGSIVLLRPATSIRIIALYAALVVLFWLIIFVVSLSSQSRARKVKAVVGGIRGIVRQVVLGAVIRLIDKDAEALCVSRCAGGTK
jgi:hypothetical protein